MIPCHAGDHEHGATCEHNHQHDSPDSNSEEDHPCSPFCMHHASYFTEKTEIPFSITIVVTDLEEMYLFNYHSLLSELHNNSFWHPPQV